MVPLDHVNTCAKPELCTTTVSVFKCTNISWLYGWRWYYSRMRWEPTSMFSFTRIMCFYVCPLKEESQTGRFCSFFMDVSLCIPLKNTFWQPWDYMANNLHQLISSICVCVSIWMSDWVTVHQSNEFKNSCNKTLVLSVTTTWLDTGKHR